jgi:hypothetical protein
MKLKYTITGFLEVDPDGEAYASKPISQSVAEYEQEAIEEGASDLIEMLSAFEGIKVTVEEYVEPAADAVEQHERDEDYAKALIKPDAGFDEDEPMGANDPELQ